MSQKSGENLDWASAYETLRTVFFKVLWRLARQGYISNAGQAMDLIHDFFAEEWSGLAARYDPSQASLKVYAAAAFERFARTRLVREARWFRMLGEGEDGNEKEDDVEAPLPDPGVIIDLARVREVLAQLDKADRQILAARFASESVSERELARGAGMSRYKFRERVATALARFVVALGDPGGLETADFSVARLIFGAGLSINQVASELSVPAAIVRAARRRVLRALGSASAEVSS